MTAGDSSSTGCHLSKQQSQVSSGMQCLGPWAHPHVWLLSGQGRLQECGAPGVHRGETSPPSHSSVFLPDYSLWPQIRAAMFTHCSIAASIAEGEISRVKPWDVDKKHAVSGCWPLSLRSCIFLSVFLQECVKRRAIKSVLWVRDIDEAEATRVVEKVFDKCYNDLEPFGRIPRRKSRDPQRSFNEGYLYGYCNR